MALPIVVTKPTTNDHWLRGNNYVIEWDDGDPVTFPFVKLSLYKGTASVSQIDMVIHTASAYTWAIPSSETIGTDYRIHVMELDL